MGGQHRLALGFFGAVVAVWLGVTLIAATRAALPVSATGMMLAAFPPGADEGTVYAAVISAGGQPLRQTWLPGVWVVNGEQAGFVGRLKSLGAMAAFGEIPVGAPKLGGCAVISADAKRPEKWRAGP